MAATKQPGFRQGASAAAALDDSPPPTTSGAERLDTILAKRKLSMRTKPSQPKISSAAAQKSFASGKAPSTPTKSYTKKLGR